MKHPVIIQGGMGVNVSNYKLARAVSSAGHLGVVSGTMLDTVLARRLQDGDADGSIRRAVEKFPLPEIGLAVLDAYFIDGGRDPCTPYKSVPMHSTRPSDLLNALTILANFVEVYLAKEGHSGVVGINYLTKIDLPTLPSLFGAMLAGVDYVLMGAGIPRAIPGIIDRLSCMQPVELKLDVSGSSENDEFKIEFDPAAYSIRLRELRRPYFLPIVSSSTLAQALIKKASGRIDGFVVEHHTAGGHNAPPRGGVHVDASGEPIYGARDEIDFNAFLKLGLPFWLAGSYADPARVREVIQAGAQGVQVGSAFALSKESGIVPELKQNAIRRIVNGDCEVFTDPVASASGYPFKVLKLEGTLSEKDVYEARNRTCDLGYLRTAFKREDGSIGFRCPAEPVDTYLKKGGRLEDTAGRKCLCNGLMSTVGYAQVQADNYIEPALVTTGKDLTCIREIVKPGQFEYSAQAVLNYLLSQCVDINPSADAGSARSA